MEFKNANQLTEICSNNNIPISEAMIQCEMFISQKSREEIISQMTHSYNIMKKSVYRALSEDLKSIGGLIGGEAKKILNRGKNNKSVCGTLMNKAIGYAMGVLEVNTSMGLIVAAPTAGASGVIPGVFIALQEEFNFTDETMTKMLFNAGAIGYLITRNATVSGAEGGCQAEVGSASAMAASAIIELMDGDVQKCLDASSTALANILGLVCDPIAGLVEVPCQKRNALGASNAMISAEITLSGIVNRVPFDEMVTAMYNVGRSLPFELRETALGGIAATPTGCRLCKSIL
ncbi:L-serine dehydratase, iron-sulfur-dependent subunit alpha [Candidatus Epulonipiscium fishelsonii]|uniref:L-serine dehydratase, iron-sulfur-dependent subunit alpha n=1 Tax=Candidatus Epulonipiscium fishelsonii TaxID=77094 RepID=A0ACC8X851_9FIRM|nr:L-serine dehydratase, iron-sulfur-dependent subunit alpha [Epulopiscium sp. SCG-B11WGA-EpuloA1]ONI40706.1 L-serine dehydratase, iron-sulfur-dependent subunit alpha [Epulopiscium sp. SCG-B05WGA-EpuloA1]